MSTHIVPVLRIADIEKHPNADTLGLVKVHGYVCAVRLGEFKPGDLVAYIEPDMVVPASPQFAFLGESRRIRARKLRGIYSQGLLTRAPEGAKEGDNVMEALGVTRWEPVDTSGDTELPHESLRGIPSYDLENWRGGSQVTGRAWKDLLEPGEEVVITEKLHGMNARYAWRAGRMWCGSRSQWKAQSDSSPWWKALKAHPWVEEMCRALPRSLLYGEVFGNVPGMRYGYEQGALGFRAFDALTDGTWADAGVFFLRPGEHYAPVLYRGPYDPAVVEELSRGESRLAKHMMEGIVIKPAKERTDAELGRVALKLVSDRYLEKS